MSVAVRPREAEDLPRLADILLRVHATDGYPVEGVAKPLQWLTPPRTIRVWTATHDGQPIGQLAITRASGRDDAARAWQTTTGGDLDQLVIPARLFVEPERRGSGAGRALMTIAAAYAQHHGVSIAFDVMLKDQAAVRLYETMGAERIAVVNHQHGTEHNEPAAVYVLPQPRPGGAIVVPNSEGDPS